MEHWNIEMIHGLTLHPARNAHPRLFCYEHLVLQFTAFKEDTLAAYGRYILHSIAVMDGQLASISLLPTRVQVHDHRKLPAVVVAKLISVTRIEGSLFVQRVMEFVAGDAGIASAI